MSVRGGLRVAVIRNHFFGRNHPDVADAVEQAIAWFGAEGAIVSDVTLPNLEYGLGAIFAIEPASSAAYHDVRLRKGQVQHFAPDVRMLVEMGRLVTGADLAAEIPVQLCGSSGNQPAVRLDRDALPIGLQIAARRFDEVTLLRAASAYEAAHNWQDRHPPSA